MARTHGHGNPNWGRDEVILALDLYFRCNGQIPTTSDPRVQALSLELRSLPYHEEASRRESFRNVDGVTFKLQNLRQIATGKGLQNVSATDRQVWAEFGHRPEAVRYLAAAIRAGATNTEAEVTASDYQDEEFPEGRILTELHKRRERNRKVRKQLLEARRKRGPLICELCGKPSPATASEFEAASFEAHHLLGLAAGLGRKTRMSDMALLHANCHRLLHAAIILKKAWLSLDEARAVIGFRS